MGEYYCTNCGAILDNQHGFEDNDGTWICTQCGQYLYGDEIKYKGEKYKGVIWYCDNCNAILSNQTGFNDYNSIWRCTECGYVNSIKEDEILDSQMRNRSSEFVHSIFDAIINSINTSNEENKDNYDNNEEDEYEENRYWYEEDEDEYNEDSDDNYEEASSYHTEYYNEADFNQANYDNVNIQSAIDPTNVPKNEKKKQYWIVIAFFMAVSVIETIVLVNQFIENKGFSIDIIYTIIIIFNSLVATYISSKVIKYLKLKPLGISSEDIQTRKLNDIASKLNENGFTNIILQGIEDLDLENKKKEGYIKQVLVGKDNMFSEVSKYPYDTKIIVRYHKLKRISLPIKIHKVKDKNYHSYITLFRESGFVNIQTVPVYDIIIGWRVKNGDIKKILIEGKSRFKLTDTYRPDTEIILLYHSSRR